LRVSTPVRFALALGVDVGELCFFLSAALADGRPKLREEW